MENRELVVALIEADESESKRDEPPPGGEPTFDADQVQVDERGKDGTTGEIEVEQLTDEQLAEMWMRRLQSTPADFLRQRFAVEIATALETEDDGS